MPKEKGFSPLLIIVILAILGLAAVLGFKIFNPAELKNNKIPPTPKTKSSTDTTKLILPKLTYDGAYNGPLCDSSSKMGDSAPLDLHLENMERNGVGCFIAYVFAQEEEDLTPLRDPMKKYPGRIIPFYASGLGGDEANPIIGDKLTKLFEDGLVLAKKTLGENEIIGIGELETMDWSLPHNNPKVLQLFDFAKKNNLKVMFHPLPGRASQIKDILEKYPDTTFLIHMFKEDFASDRSNIIDLMKNHKNLYFTIDVDHLLYDSSAGTGLLYKYQDKDTKIGKDGFIKDFEARYETMLKNDLSLYKPLIEAVPDQVVWGTEMNVRYTYEPEVYDRIIKFIRLFIGNLDSSMQEKVGYKTTLGVFRN